MEGMESLLMMKNTRGRVHFPGRSGCVRSLGPTFGALGGLQKGFMPFEVSIEDEQESSGEVQRISSTMINGCG